MTLLHAALAGAGLACVAIPILIHLLMRRRRRPVMWGAMRFLLEAYRKHRKRLLIEQWLLLAARCLIVALVALAVGRPLLGALSDAGGAGRTVYLLIDNSLASGVRGADGVTALDRHKAAALETIAALSAGATESDRVGLIALGAPADGVVIPASTDLAAVSDLVSELTPTASRADIAGGLALIGGATGEGSASSPGGGASSRVYAVLLSDLLAGSADVSSGLRKLPAGVTLVSSLPAASGPEGGNVTITSVEPLRSLMLTGSGRAGSGAGPEGAATADQLRVSLTRTGEGARRAETTTVRVRLRGVAGSDWSGPEQRTAVRWAAGQETAVATVQLTGGSGASSPGGPDDAGGTGSASIWAMIDADAVTGDNTWHRPVEVRSLLRVGVVSSRSFGRLDRIDRLDAGTWVRLALRPSDDASVEVVDIEPATLDGARLAGLDAVVVVEPDAVPAASWAKMRSLLDAGGLVIVMPPAGGGVNLWTDAMESAFSTGWRIAREPQEVEAGAGRVVPGGMAAPAGDATGVSRGGAGPAGATGDGVSADQGVTDLLSVISGEMDELVRPVTVWRVLPVEGAGAEGAGGADTATRRTVTPLLALADGTGLVYAARAGEGDATREPDTAGELGAEGAENAPRDRHEAGGRGLVVYIAAAFDLDWTDLPSKPLMVPLMQELVHQGVGRAHGSWWSVAGSRPPAPGRAVELVFVEVSAEAGAGDDAAGAEKELALIPVDESGRSATAIRFAGLWRAVDERGGVRGVVAVNHDAAGGNVEPLPVGEVERWLRSASSDGAVSWMTPARADGGADATVGLDGPAGSDGPRGVTIASILSAREEGLPISVPLLIAALVVAVIETVLARVASHAGVSGAAVPAGGRA